MVVRDVETGRWYDPNAEFEKMFKEHWFVSIMKRLKFR
jgi:hypothetical protein